MKYALAHIAFGLGANALVARDVGQQCIQLKASGGASGILGQLDDGQNRIGGGHPTGCYCLSNGGFTDSKGRGCILTPPTTQLQCDVGAKPTTGFAIGSNGGVTYNGSGKFYACPVNDKGEYNVYSQSISGQSKCVEISLSSAGSCGAGSGSGMSPSSMAPKPSACPVATVTVIYTKEAANTPAPSPMSAPAPKPAPSSGTCPADLNGNYQYPHLIIPVDSSSPNSAPGTSYNGKVNSHTCSIFNFDIPMSYNGKTCTVIFLFPEQKNLQTSSYTVSGSGPVSFSMLSGNANQKTSYANQPSKAKDLGSYTIAPDNSYVVASGPCAAGKTVTYEMCSSGDYALDYFQDYNPSPIGLYVRQC